MHKLHHILSLPARLLVGTILVLAVLYTAGCRADGSHIFSLYKMDIVQGNYISKEQLGLIETGMPRSQVLTVFGTPLINDIFHANRWDYVFSIKRQGMETIERRVTVFFDGDVVAGLEVPEELFTEEEFVELLATDKKIKKRKEPVLKATPAQLEEAAKQAKIFQEKRAKEKGQSEPAEPSGNYPPLD